MLLGDVLPMPISPMHSTWLRSTLMKVIVYAHVDDAQREAVLTAEHIDTATATGEVDHLLPRHLTGRHADTLAFYAVVSTQEQVTGVRQRGGEGLLHQTYLHGKLFQAS